MGFAWLITFLFLTGFVLLNKQLDTRTVPGDTGHTLSRDMADVWDYAFWSAFVVFLISRLALAFTLDGYPSDMSCWAAWGQRLAETGTSSFYAADYFCDYPPGYLYILGLLSRFAGVFHLQSAGIAFLDKLPAVVCDMALFALLFKLGRRFFNGKAALILSCVFMLCPIFCLDSAVWGQIESVLMFLLVLSIFRLYEKRYLSAVLIYVLAVLVKPQGLILAPIYLFALLETKSWKVFLSSALGGLILFWALTMPFSAAWQTHTGMTAFLHALNPVWIIQKYLATLASYPYFSVNAFNLYSLLGLNWETLEIPGYETLLSVINSVILALGVLGSLFIFLKVKNRGSKLCLSAYFLFAFLFTFAFKMHERYIVLPILFLLMEFLFSKNRKMLYLFAGFGAAGFLNLYYILQLALTTETAPAYSIMAPIALCEAALFVISVWVIYTDYIRSPKTSDENEHAHQARIPFTQRLENCARMQGVMRALRGMGPDGSRPARQEKMVRLDYLILGGIVLIYAVTAFVNLGDSKAPQTCYKPAQAGDTFTITLEQTETITEIDYYCGIGDVDGNPGITFSYSTDGNAWTQLPDTFCKLNSVFKWEVQTLEPIQAKYLRGVSQSGDYMLFELGLRNQQGELAAVASVTGSLDADYGAMADEQDCVTNAPSYENGTYFDEIYHPRTAYEHLHMMPYYETTHPPLGKLMMSVGIMLFGMSPFGWRCVGTFMGVLMLPIFYLFLKKMFGRTRYAVLGTLLFAFDFMHFSLTRIGTIDSYPVFFILCMYYFMYRFGKSALSWARGACVPFRSLVGQLALSGLAMGLGCASKWTAVYASAGLAVEFLVILILVWRALREQPDRSFGGFFCKTCAWCLLFFVAVPAGIYTLSYLPISMVDGYGNVFEAMWNNQKYMLDYHSELGGTHPYSSKWYTWPFVYKPMWAYQAPEASIQAGQIGCISIFQNPLLSWMGIGAFFYALWAGWRKRDKRVLFLLIALLAQYLPWIFVKRYALQYHFFATLPFLIFFVVYALQDLERRFDRFGYVSAALTAACLVLFIQFYPVISGVPVSRFFAQTVLTWFKPWIFFI